jgi:two-component system LytT family response regulator
MIRAVIVDDEPLSRRAIRQLLARHPDVEITGECCDGVEATEAVRALRPDVLFLDVRIPEVSGIDVARARGGGRSAPLVVFVTAFDQFALPAFETDAVDYLTKPVTEDRFDVTLGRVRDRLDMRARLLAATPVPRRFTDRLIARVRDREIVIPTGAIEYVEADDVYAAVHVAGGRHLVRASLDALQQELDPHRFVRVHRSYIVAIDRIAAVRQVGHGQRALLLTTGVTIPVSRRRRREVGERVRNRRGP